MFNEILIDYDFHEDLEEQRMLLRQIVDKKYAIGELESSFVEKHNVHRGPDGKFTYCDGSCKGGGSSSLKNDYGKTLSAGQSAYFGNSQAVDENGNLITVYHGTVHDFTEFDTDRANPENDIGQGIYFSDNTYDVDSNYATEEGPDLRNKMDIYRDMLENEGMDFDEADALTRETFITAEAHTLTCYLNIENPVRLGGNKETFFDFNDGYDPDTEEFDDASGKLVDYYNAIENLVYSGKYEVYNERDFLGKVSDKFFGDAIDWGGMSAEEAIRGVKDAAAFNDVYTTNHYGDMVYGGAEMAREALQSLGYDGIIDKTVSQKFWNMDNMTRDTTHYIVFDSNQAKLVDNLNPTKDPNINKSVNGGKKMAGYNIYKLDKAEQAIVNALTKKCWDGEKRNLDLLCDPDRRILTKLLDKAGKK